MTLKIDLLDYSLEGFVVCEEHKDILLAAWDEEQEIQKQKEAEVGVDMEQVQPVSETKIGIM